MPTRTVAWAGLLLVALAACGGGDGGTRATPGASPAQTQGDGGMGYGAGGYGGTKSDADSGTATPAGASVAVASTSLGEVLVGPDGRTLYVFDPDKQGESTCYDQCAQAWPPLTVGGEPAAGPDVDAAKLGTAARNDGSMQVTYDSWPLYYFAQDTATGDVNGQGVNDVWWVLAPSGEPIRQ